MSSATDIQAGDWIDRRVPEPIRPYLRLARIHAPIGTWLLLFPGWWSLALAAALGDLPNGYVMVLFAIGAFVMRGAGCTVNDIVDRDFDAKVARTANRPLASGRLSLTQAVAFLALQLRRRIRHSASAFAVRHQARRALAVAGGRLSLHEADHLWPQAFLGLTFNWGALMGYAAVTDTLAWPPVLLYIAGFFWTLFYDTIYAHQDKEDDALIGVKSTARYFGEDTRTWLMGFAVATVLLLMTVVTIADLGWAAKLGVIGVAVHLGWQVLFCNFDDPSDCKSKFYSNRFIGWILLAGLIIAKLMQ